MPLPSFSVNHPRSIEIGDVDDDAVATEVEDEDEDEDVLTDVDAVAPPADHESNACAYQYRSTPS